MPKTSTEDRAWIAEAIRRVDADANRSADTHLHVLPIPVPGIDLYLKDESVHPTGSLKHRLARSLFLYALCNGWIGPKSTVIEASSGSTAVSEAFFARLIGLPFVAVMPATTSPEKIALIEFYGGQLPPGRRSGDDLRRGAPPGVGVQRALHGPVHLRRAGDGLARQQQHRRVDLRADAGRAASLPELDRRRRGHRWHLRDDRPIRPLPTLRDPHRGRRPRELRVLRRLGVRQLRRHDRHSVAYRGHRPDARRAVLRRRRHRRHGAGPRCCVDRRDAVGLDDPWPAGRRLDRHQRLGVAPAHRPDARRRRGPAASSPSVRWGRALCSTPISTSRGSSRRDSTSRRTRTRSRSSTRPAFSRPSS